MVAAQETLRSLRRRVPRLPPPSTPDVPVIDVESGAIAAAEGTISSSMSRTQFLLSTLFDMGQWSNEHDGWYVAETVSLTLADEPFGGSVMFHHEDMDSVSLWIDDPQYGTGWDHYSLEKEEARNRRHEAWLREHVGKWSGTFPWGAIYCGVDSKGGAASIVVSYRKTRRR